MDGTATWAARSGGRGLEPLVVDSVVQGSFRDYDSEVTYRLLEVCMILGDLFDVERSASDIFEWTKDVGTLLVRRRLAIALRVDAPAPRQVRPGRRVCALVGAGPEEGPLRGSFRNVSTTVCVGVLQTVTSLRAGLAWSSLHSRHRLGLMRCPFPPKFVSIFST